MGVGWLSVSRAGEDLDHASQPAADQAGGAVQIWVGVALGNLRRLFSGPHDKMQQYDEGDYGKTMYENKVKEYTTELEALKTLAL